MSRNGLILSLGIVSVVLAPSALSLEGAEDFVACWSLNEGEGGVAHDASSHTLHGTVHGATWQPGAQGHALGFLPDDYVDVSNASGCPEPIGALRTGSISVWFRIDPVATTEVQRPIFYVGDGVGGDGHSGLVIEIGHDTPGTPLYFTIYGDDADILLCFDSAHSLEVGVWHHFVAVVGQGFNTGYLNGEEMVDRHYNSGGPTDRYFLADVLEKNVCWLGKGFSKDLSMISYYEGDLDEVRVYDRPLTATEITEHYEWVRSWSRAFIRGDANADGVFDVADPLHTLEYLFLGGSVPCLAALDADGSATIDIVDPIFALDDLFGSGSPPGPPFPGCALPPLPGAYPCEEFPACP